MSLRAHDDPTIVLVLVCTYRRPDKLLDLLTSLDKQIGIDPLANELRVLVVDNSPDVEARATVRAFADRAAFSVSYSTHGAGNIASGRNEALRLVPSDVEYVVLVDDDEIASPDWVSCLLAAQKASQADVVTGPVLARYPPGTRAWLQSDEFFSVTGPDQGGFVDEAVTGNALLRMGLVRDLELTFDTSLGLSGGEDQLFFRSARARGASIWFEPAAVVHEAVPHSRLALRYLIRREYRKGNTLGLLDRGRPGWPPGRPVRRFMSSVHWATTGSLATAIAVTKRDRQSAAAGLMRLARSLGMLYGLSGRTYQHYRAPAADAREVVALVLAEGPDYQLAGHSRYLSGYVSHFETLGMKVVVVVTTQRLGFVLRRRGVRDYRAQGLVTIGDWHVAASPGLWLRWFAWKSFRAAPRALQTVVDHVRTARRASQHVDHDLGRPLDRTDSAFVCKVLGQDKPEVVLFSSIFAVPTPLELPSSVRATAVICHDVVSQRADDLRAHGYHVSPADFDAVQEARLLEGMSAVIAIQWDEAQVLRSMSPAEAAVVVCPVAIEPVRGSMSPVSGQVLFVGSGSLANVNGLRWFLDECWATVSERVETARLHVVGTVCARIGSVPAGVVLRGEVEDLRHEYSAASAVIVPLRTGSGLKIKIVEAICHGCPIVTTVVGAQGLGQLEPEPFLVADDPTDFAAALKDVLGSSARRRQLQDAARLAAPLFSPAAVFAELDDHLAVRGVHAAVALVGDAPPDAGASRGRG